MMENYEGKLVQLKCERRRKAAFSKKIPVRDKLLSLSKVLSALPSPCNWSAVLQSNCLIFHPLASYYQRDWDIPWFEKGWATEKLKLLNWFNPLHSVFTVRWLLFSFRFNIKLSNPYIVLFLTSCPSVHSSPALIRSHMPGTTNWIGQPRHFLFPASSVWVIELNVTNSLSFYFAQGYHSGCCKWVNE